MKTIAGIVLIFFSVLILSSCEGERGPSGFDGLDGIDGVDGEITSIFTVDGTFNSQNNYTLHFDFPSEIEVYSSDIVLIYILWDQEESTTGDLLDVWRLLPQTVLLNEGVLQYNFDYTLGDVKIFLDGTMDFNSLLPAYTDNQYFRVAVIPAAYAITHSMEVDELNRLMNSIDIDAGSIKKMSLIK